MQEQVHLFDINIAVAVFYFNKKSFSCDLTSRKKK